ncbi:tyrosine protein phosphatase [Fictibacillus enclensis]|uniref:tyrosine-protein phosphatase n=1 Tax=Fictibacillus enclensis TaxID=1017270 RepID=UPI0025A09A9B|nr:CpsB/CapC family capsule biosynthesis tyrosine phosphatase [Fictibacillus enclensis]MDM5201149.1 tyrosine protein phosphatase [Fictibacillus enclensis]
MIDVHSHILHSVDDGAKNLESSLDMARQAVGNGITTLFATPHHRNGRYENHKEEILLKTEELNQALSTHHIPLAILPGQEIRIYAEFLDDLANNQLLTLNNQGKYILIELPSNDVPTYTTQVIYECKLQGITPIIVHPERNSKLMEDPNLLYELVKEGALTQITAGSIIGAFGKKISSFSIKLINHHCTHFIASDAHNISSRGFNLWEAFDEIGRKYDADTVQHLKENAQQVLDNAAVDVQEPLPMKKKKLLGIF